MTDDSQDSVQFQFEQVHQLTQPVTASKTALLECTVLQDYYNCHAQQLRSLFEAFGLKIGLSGPTHRDGGKLGPRRCLHRRSCVRR